MKYNGFYFALFKSSIKKVLKDEFNKEYANKIIKEAKKKYKEIVINAPDIGKGNPMAFNELFALVYISLYLASNKEISPSIIQKTMKESLKSVKWYFSFTNLNTKSGKKRNKKNILKYIKWYTPIKEKKYPTSFKIDFIGKPNEEACFYRITRCPICHYAKALNVLEIMPLLCELDELMIKYEHGILYREKTIASGGEYCDYYIVGDKEKVF